MRDGKVERLRSLKPAEAHAPCIFELVYFTRPDSRIWNKSVDGARRAFGRQLAREHPVEADAVISVPDSANSAALGFAEESGIPFELGLLRNHYIGRTFIAPAQKDRDFGARLKYNPVQEVLTGKRVVVVDDSLVRGTTSRSFYGIDMPTRGELIGAHLEVGEIEKKLAVDSLGYLSLEGMVAAVEDAGPYCTACFSGNYPAPLVDVEKGLASADGPARC
jgi:amidophosphoribosyltransferase